VKLIKIMVIILYSWSNLTCLGGAFFPDTAHVPKMINLCRFIHLLQAKNVKWCEWCRLIILDHARASSPSPSCHINTCTILIGLQSLNARQNDGYIHLAANTTAVSNTSRSGWTEAGMFWWHRHCATLGDVQWFKRRTCQNAAETVTHAGRRLLRTIAVDVGRECMQ